MDNVLKYILGFLGIFGLILLAMPSSNSDEDNVTRPIATAKPAPKPVTAKPASKDESSGEKSSKDDDWGDDEYESFGQPMNDAKPLGTSENGSSDNDSSRRDSDQSMQPIGSPAIGGQRTADSTSDAE